MDATEIARVGAVSRSGDYGVRRGKAVSVGRCRKEAEKERTQPRVSCVQHVTHMIHARVMIIIYNGVP